MANEADIQAFVEFSGQDRGVAIQYLQCTSNNVEQAVQMFFDGRPPTAPAVNIDTWSEDAFTGDRYGNAVGAHANAFNIEAAEAAHSKAPSSTPTRAQSPNRMAYNGFSNDGQISDFGNQQSGVIGGNSEKYFGPANKQYYDTDKWALTLPGPAIEEKDIIPDVEPGQRRRDRESGLIPFFKPLPATPTDYLPAAMTIFANIPHLRNFLLQLPPTDILDYGYHAAWWTGSAIENPSQSWDDQDQTDLTKELHRLAAFAYTTNRAYGSVEPLARILTSNPEDLARRDPECSSDAGTMLVSRLLYEVERLFQSDEPTGVFLSLFGEDSTRGCWELPFDRTDMEESPTLYELLDRRILDDSFSSYVRPAGVVTLHLKDQTKSSDSLDVAIPTVLYLDRYVDPELSGVDGSWRQARGAIIDKHAKLGKQAEDIRKFTSSKTGKEIDPLKLLERCQTAFSESTTTLEAPPGVKGAETSSKPDNVNLSSWDKERDWALSELGRRAERIQKSLEDLKEQQRQARVELAGYRSHLTDASDSAETKPSVALRLCGVSTRPTITYVRCDQIGTGHLSTENEQPPIIDGSSSDRWVRSDYDWGGAEPEIRRDVYSTEMVLDAIKREGPSAIFVYVSEEVLRQRAQEHLSESLTEFMAKDNAEFDAEVANVLKSGTWEEMQEISHGTAEVVGAWDDSGRDTAWDDVPNEWDQTRAMSVEPQVKDITMTG